MSIFCRHNWQTAYVMNYSYNTYLPAYYECTKCRARRMVSQETISKIIEPIKAKEDEERLGRILEMMNQREGKRK